MKIEKDEELCGSSLSSGSQNINLVKKEELVPSYFTAAVFIE